jgi:hypothetical protein
MSPISTGSVSAGSDVTFPEPMQSIDTHFRDGSVASETRKRRAAASAFATPEEIIARLRKLERATMSETR